MKYNTVACYRVAGSMSGSTSTGASHNRLVKSGIADQTQCSIDRLLDTISSLRSELATMMDDQRKEMAAEFDIQKGKLLIKGVNL